MDDISKELRVVHDAAGIGTLCRVTDVRYQQGTANQMAGYVVTWENRTVTLVDAEADAQRLAFAQKSGQPVLIEGQPLYVGVKNFLAALKGEAQP